MAYDIPARGVRKRYTVAARGVRGPARTPPRQARVARGCQEAVGGVRSACEACPGWCGVVVL
eukprot:2531534-Prymnesium_polylepis.1